MVTSGITQEQHCAEHGIPDFPGIYAIRHVASGKLYIGSAVSIAKRWQHHRTDLIHGKHHSRHLQRAWDKYGTDSFAWEVLETVSDKADLISKEQEWIDRTGSYRRTKGYNISPTAGSNLGLQFGPMSPEHRAKVSAALTGKTHSPEARAKISAARKGKKFSPESRAKMSLARNGKPGRPHTSESRAKVSAARKGKSPILEHRSKLSSALKGKPGRPKGPEERAKISEAMKGRPKSPEARAKMSATRRAKFAQVKLEKHQDETLFLREGD